MDLKTKNRIEMEEIIKKTILLIEERKLNEIEHVLRTIDIPNTSVDVLLSYLSMTIVIENDLPYRAIFYRRVKEELEYREEDYKLLLGRL